jgi:hypothetical protein
MTFASLAGSQSKGHVVTHVLLGLFLLSAAAFKAHALLTGAPSANALVLSPRAQLGLIELEAFFGVLLLFGQIGRLGWAMAIGLFAMLAAVSLYLGLDGQPSCGCFGRLSVNPWLTFALDLAAVAALVIWRPRPDRGRPAAGWRSTVFEISAAVGCLALSFAGLLFMAGNHRAEVLARLRGDAVTVEPEITRVGDGIRGEERSFGVQLTNRSNRPVCIMGGTNSCPCFATDNLPLQLAPGESRGIQVRMKFSGMTGRFVGSYLLYTDDGYQNQVIGYFAGRVRETPEEESKPAMGSPEGTNRGAGS